MHRHPSQDDDGGDNPQEHRKEGSEDEVGITLSKIHATQEEGGDRARVNASQNECGQRQAFFPFCLSADRQQGGGEDKSTEDEREMIAEYLVHLIKWACPT